MTDSIVKQIQQRQQAVSAQIASLEAESKKLALALKALAGTVKAPGRRGRPPKLAKAAKPIRKRRMSAAGRAAIAAAARKRWAKVRQAKAGKKAAKPAKKRKMSAAGRAAIAAAAKARWAKVRAAKAATGK